MRIGIVHTVGSPCRCAESAARGIAALHHESYIIDSKEIESYAIELASKCDLVIDHTDTFCGRGLYRPLVRLLLENCGARVLGASAQSCFLADNKAAAKERLSQFGIPTPPGMVVYSNDFTLPRWLQPPFVLKPAYEHMSRGIQIIKSADEAIAAAVQMLTELKQPILIESYIRGRELSISIIEGPEGLEVLPILEWDVSSSENRILTESFKLMDPDDERHDILPAVLDKDVQQEIQDLAKRAFAALDLRDYARFDARLSPGENILFLEANTTPSLEPKEALAFSAACAGLDYPALIDRLIQTACRRYAPRTQKENRKIISFPPNSIELEISEGVHALSQSTEVLAGLLDVQPGDDVLELGCGSGLLAIAAAKLGARRVVATDLDPKALEAAAANARLNGVDDKIEFRAGAWYEALNDEEQQFEVIIATPPQTPGKTAFGPKYGGPDGARHLCRIVRQAPHFLKPDGGRLWLLAISLAHPARVLNMLRELFEDVVIADETEREFSAAEYDALQEGLFDYLLSLRASGIAEFTETQGVLSFRNLFMRASKPRRI